jgi:hypothetical protein
LTQRIAAPSDYVLARAGADAGQEDGGGQQVRG